MFEEVRRLVKECVLLQQQSASSKVLPQIPYLNRLEAIEMPHAETDTERRVKEELTSLKQECAQLKDILSSCEDLCRQDELHLDQLKKQLAHLVATRQEDAQTQGDEYKAVNQRLQATLLACAQSRNRLQELKIAKIERRRLNLARR